MTIESEAPPTHDQQITSLTHRITKLEALLQRGLNLLRIDEPTRATNNWRAEVIETLPKLPQMSARGRAEMIERCSRVGINIFTCEEHLLSTNTITGRQIELLLIDIQKHPLSQSQPGE